MIWKYLLYYQQNTSNLLLIPSTALTLSYKQPIIFFVGETRFLPLFAHIGFSRRYLRWVDYCTLHAILKLRSPPATLTLLPVPLGNLLAFFFIC